MTQDFLSQDEVDTLLKGAPGEAQAASAPPPVGGVHAYDLGRQERSLRGPMHALDGINERFVRQAGAEFAKFTRGTPTLAPGVVRVVKYGDFVRDLAVPASLNLMHLKPLRGNALFVLDPGLIFTVIDGLFGGNGRVQSPPGQRDFSLTEQRIIRRLLSIFAECYQSAWRPVFPLVFDFVRAESHARFARIAAPGESVVVTSFPIELGSPCGQLQICIPYAALEPIRDRLAEPAQGDQRGPDKRWLQMLSQQVQLAEVELRANLATVPLPISQLLGMKVGDVIAFNPPEAIAAEVDGVPIFECRYGVLNRHYAIKVERVLANPAQEGKLGGERAA